MKPPKGNGSRERAASTPDSEGMSSTEPTAVQPQYEPHPLALTFPALDDKHLAELAADIKRRGLLHPIVIYEGKILDGVQRYNACQLANVYPKRVQFDKLAEDVRKQGPAAFVLSQNLFRRQLHLTDDQRVAIVTKLRKPQFEAEARERKKASQFVAKSPNESPSEPTVVSKSTPPSDKTHERIAKEAKATPYKARQAGKLTAEELDDVAKGKKKLRDIEKRTPKRKQPKKEKTLEERIWARWLSWIKKYSPAEALEVKKLVHKWTEGAA